MTERIRQLQNCVRPHSLWRLVQLQRNMAVALEDFDSRAHSDENRFSSAQFGVAAQRKASAFDNALQFADGKQYVDMDGGDILNSLLQKPMRVM